MNCICLAFLTNQQFHFINKELFQNNREHYLKLLFLHSQPFVRSEHYKFCQNSKIASKMNTKQKHDLLYYGYCGLWKAVRNYNGKNNFYKYASFYVDGELKQGISDHLTSCILPHRYRVSRQYMKDNNMSPNFVTSFSQIDDNYENNLQSKFTNDCVLQEIDYLYDIIYNLSNKDRLYFTLRYDIFTCKIRRTYKNVSQLMCVSEETARQNIRRITRDVVSQINT